MNGTKRRGRGYACRAVLLAGMLAFAAVLSVAQSDAPPPPPPPGGMMTFHAPGPMGDGMFSEMGEGKPVKGAPMTADLVVTRDTVLANGTHIHNVTQSKIYRDMDGRIRREIGVELNTPATGTVKRAMVVLVDPVSGNRYLLDTANKTARQMPIRHGTHGPGGRHDGPPANGKFGDASNVKVEQLGNKTINGLQAEGTRVTRTIPAGEIGNDKAIEVISERWVSTDLQIPLMVTHNDPMMGVVTTTVTNITRAEPDASLFVVPSDYKVETGRRSDPF